MGRSNQIMPRKRAVMLQYSKDGLKQSKICKRLGLSRSTVSQLLQQFATTWSMDVKRRSGRPRITSRRDDTLIRRCSVVNPTYSATHIMVETNVRASSRTIRRRLLNEFGLASRRPAKKSLLTQKQRLKRLKFCLKYEHWSSEDWVKGLFSDETLICQFGAPAVRVRRPVGQRFNAKYTARTMKHSQKVMVWGVLFTFLA